MTVYETDLQAALITAQKAYVYELERLFQHLSDELDAVKRRLDAARQTQADYLALTKRHNDSCAAARDERI